MLDALPDPVIITGQAHHIIAHNERADHLLFQHAEDSAGRRRAVSLNNVLFSSFLARGLVVGDSGAAPRELSLADPATGNDLLFEVLSRPVPSQDGSETIVSVLHDVTDLRHATTGLLSQVERAQRAEAEARAERDRLNLVLENVADPILVTDPATNTMLMNQQAEELFHGRRPADAIGAAREDVTVGSNDTKVTSFISEFALTAESSRRERLSLQEPDTKAELPVEVVSGKVFANAGEPIAIVSVFHDLRKQVENERL
jgi:PAS domain S-box-containing protein